jgi:IS5 family transposase
MKNKNPRGLFDETFRLEKLSKQGDPLLLLKAKINWEIFRPTLESIFAKEDKGQGGREPYNYLMMFKILILQRYYNLSDDQTEYQILDRLSFMRFLELELSDKVPDSKTIWLFKETIAKSGKTEELFNTFEELLKSKGYIGKEGKIVDASFVEVPRQRNSREENKQIKEGKVPEEWQENPHKLSQKDTDARWTKKNNETFYGYKNHVKVDTKSKLINNYEVTPASVHDSQALDALLKETENEGQSFYADSAYVGPAQETVIEKSGMKNCVIEKGYKNKPLTDEQKANNKAKSKIRVRVEHVFGFVENSMHGSYIRCIGMIRAEATIGLMNLTYNIFRYIQLNKIPSMG